MRSKYKRKRPGQTGPFPIFAFELLLRLWRRLFSGWLLRRGLHRGLLFRGTWGNVRYARHPRDLTAFGVGHQDTKTVEGRSGGAIQFDSRFLVGGISCDQVRLCLREIAFVL